MITSAKEAQQFFLQLQRDLQADRAAEKNNADPLYYGIHDYKEVVTADGYGDRYSYYDPEAAEQLTEQEAIRRLPLDTINDLIESKALSKNPPDGYTIQYTADVHDAIREDTDILILELQNISYIREDALFLTRADAKAHLACNGHNYTTDATDYAMTAIRSPRYAQLLRLLRGDIDWEHSKLKFRTKGETT